MNQENTPRSWAKRILKIALIIELVWVVLVNGLLFLPLTQDVINKIKPEKFYVQWDRAWSWYPGRVHVRGGFANGQSRTQQWQVDVGYAAGSVSLLPLIIKRVWIRRVVAEDAHYSQRPRLKADRDYTDRMPYFPDIKGWEVTEAITTPRKKKRPWKGTLNGATLRGKHSIWIMNMKGEFAGTVEADLTFESHGGPFSLDAHDIDLTFQPLMINNDVEIFRHGAIAGSVGFEPFVAKEHKDITMLEFLKVDAEVDFDLNSLAFMNVFLLNFQEITVNGKGQVNGRIRFDQGYVLDGTDLSVDASDLLVRVENVNIQGDGNINLELGPDTDQQLDLSFEYANLAVTHDSDATPFLTGQDMLVRLGGDGQVMSDPETPNRTRTISYVIEGLTVPDLSLFQRYIPDHLPLVLYGGEGTLAGSLSLASDSASVDLKLESDAADMGAKQYRFDTNLDAALKLDNPAIMSGGTDLSGTYVRLTNARLRVDNESTGEPWGASVAINKGELSLFGDHKQSNEDVFDLFQLLAETETKHLLGGSSGLLGFDAEVSSLAWINVFFNQEHPAAVSGSGTIAGDIMLEGALPAPGTNVAVKSQELAVDVMDYVATGDGEITLKVEEGGHAPDWRVDIALQDANMRRQGEDEPGIEDVVMTVKAVVEDVTFEEKASDFNVEFQIPSAKVTDMATFNAYLPPDAKMRFTGGTADLTADIELQRESATGFVKLFSDDLEVGLEEQTVEADLAVDVVLAGGTPGDMVFDIKGSDINLTNVEVVGEKEEFDQESWSAKLLLTRGDITWTQPPKLDAVAELTMSDSRPFVAMFDNHGWKPKFLSEAITVDDIVGTAEMRMENEVIQVPEAFVTSDHIDVGMKGTIRHELSDGVIFFSYKEFDAVLKVTDGKKNLDIIKARETYDAYRVE